MDDELRSPEFIEERVERRRLDPRARPCSDSPGATLVGVPFAATDPDDTIAVRAEAAGDVPPEKAFRANNPYRCANIGTTSAGLQRLLRIRRHCSSRMKSADPRSPSRATLRSVRDAADGIHRQKQPHLPPSISAAHPRGPGQPPQANDPRPP